MSDAPKIRKLSLRHFKGFRQAELNLSDFTVLVGTNASGKSNLRDAFRFLHGIARGYSLPDVFGEKWVEGGVLQWRGIRGGVREARFDGASSFSVAVETESGDSFQYAIEIGVRRGLPFVVREQLDRRGLHVLKAEPRTDRLAPEEALMPYLTRKSVSLTPRLLRLHRRRLEFISALESIRFLDLSPETLRMPSIPGQTVLGDRGENLSSVLLAICDDSSRKEALLEWVRQLTPMDVVDFKFVFDAAGRVLVTFVEPGGRVTSALSASDGTLRFLAIVSAFLTPEPARLYFFEEIDTGLHPSRLHLLVDLIESHTARGNTQVIATTHSPQLLGVLSERSLEAATLAYRVPGTDDQRLVRVMDLPDAARVLRQHDIARLQATGWLEDAVSFAADSKAV
jgi:predicted ATPase